MLCADGRSADRAEFRFGIDDRCPERVCEEIARCGIGWDKAEALAHGIEGSALPRDCRYTVRQIAIKTKYGLRLTAPEKRALRAQLQCCS